MTRPPFSPVWRPPRGIRISATGAYLPAEIVSNEDLVRRGAPLTPDEIERVCGVRSRRYAAADEASSDLAREAAVVALARAEIEPQALSRIVLATVSPDHSSPAAACGLQAGLGAFGVPSHDITAACSGFIYAIELAARAVATGDTAVLAVAADIRSRYLDLSDRATCALFGDGAGAAIIEPGEEGSGLLATCLFADGRGLKSVYVPAGGSREPTSPDTIAAGRHRIHMADGAQVYLDATEGMLGLAEHLLGALDLSFADVALVVPHQANLRILQRLARLARIPAERVMVNIEDVGNISGATVPVALDRALGEGRVREGDLVLLLAAGAGHTAGAALYRVDAPLLAASSRWR